MGALVGAMETQFLDGFEVTDRTRELLTANGWREPAIGMNLLTHPPDGCHECKTSS